LVVSISVAPTLIPRHFWSDFIIDKGIKNNISAKQKGKRKALDKMNFQKCLGMRVGATEMLTTNTCRKEYTSFNH
jgi:hypothetical protein